MSDDYFDFALEAEDLEDLHKRYKWDNIDNASIAVSIKVHPVICYDLIDLSVTPYHFHQECFDNKDIREYFNSLKYISQHTIEDLIQNSNYRFHFHKSKIIGNLRNELQKLHKKNNIYPEIYHFALYTSKEKANRNSGIKSPRIYFVIGYNGMIYPLFYDPYHEINP